MFLGFIYLLLGFGLIVGAVVTTTGLMVPFGLGLGILGYVFLSRARAERQAQADYQRMMNLIHRL